MQVQPPLFFKDQFLSKVEYHCKSENIVRHGITGNGKQRYKCSDCERTSRDLPQPAGYSTDQQERILRAYEERSSLRGLERIFGVSHKTVTTSLKKKSRSFQL